MTLAILQWYHMILGFFFAVLAILLIIVILLQRGRGVGLAGAFGGAGGGTAFGAKTGDVLTWVTIVGAVLLLTFAVILNFVFVSTPPPLAAPPPPPSPATQPATGPAALHVAPDAELPAMRFAQGRHLAAARTVFGADRA